MKKKNKLVLVESEMFGPKGHFLDNLIETTNTFKHQNKIYWFINKRFLMKVLIYLKILK